MPGLHAICYNTVEGDKLGLTAPTSWMDLTKPEYAGHVVMPNPASSGTGFLDVSSWLQIFGEDKGWEYMDALHENIAAYTHSGSKPCKMAAAGETVIGVSFAFRGAKSKAEGAPIEIIVPTEGIGWDMEASAIVAGTANEEAAKTLAGLDDHPKSYGNVQCRLCRCRHSGHRQAGRTFPRRHRRCDDRQ